MLSDLDTQLQQILSDLRTLVTTLTALGDRSQALLEAQAELTLAGMLPAPEPPSLALRRLWKATSATDRIDFLNDILSLQERRTLFQDLAREVEE